LYPLSAGFSDICVFLDDALVNPEEDIFINSLFSCSENSVLGDLTHMGEAIFETAGNVSCSFYSEIDSIRLPCDKDNDEIITVTDPMLPSEMCSILEFRNDTSPECDFSTFSMLSKTTRIYDRKIGCYCAINVTTNLTQYKLQEGTCGSIHSLYDYSEEDCPAKSSLGMPCTPMYCHNKNDDALRFDDCSLRCSDRGMIGNASYLLQYTKVAEDVFDLYNKKIKPYLNCESIVGITTHAKDFICVHMINAVTPMYIGEILGAAGCFVGTFVALLSTKRFRKKYRRKYAIIKEGQEAIEL